MDWTRVLSKKGWLSLRSVDPPPRHVTGGIVQLGDGMYAYSVPHNQALDRSDPGVPYTGLVLWAPNDGAAIRALSTEFERDDPSVRESPPPELSAHLHGATYGEILAGGRRMNIAPFESAVYRIASDGLFIRKELGIGNITYLFRERGKKRGEAPFAVKIGLSRVGPEL